MQVSTSTLVIVQVSTQTADGVYCGIQMERTIRVCGTSNNVQVSMQAADGIYCDIQMVHTIRVCGMTGNVSVSTLVILQ